jgi:hypothetical protein
VFCDCVIIFILLLTEKWEELKSAWLLGAWHPVSTVKLNCSTFREIQHGMSVLIRDVMVFLCVVLSDEEIKFSQCVH